MVLSFLPASLSLSLPIVSFFDLLSYSNPDGFQSSSGLNATGTGGQVSPTNLPHGSATWSYLEHQR